MTRLFWSTLALVGSMAMLPGSVRAGQAPPAPAPSEVAAPAIPRVVAPGTKVTLIKEGFQGTEGPIALPDGSVIFTETNASRITRIDKDNAVSTFLENTNGSNGLAFDAKGRLISVQTTPGRTRVGVIYPKGSETTFEDAIDGRPNDLVVDRRGGVYFTVPGPVVLPDQPPATKPFVPAVYYIAPGATAVKVLEGITNPNGIQLSKDERTLYINDTRGEYLLAFDLATPGKPTNRRNFGKYAGVTATATGVTSGADGLAIDDEGRVYAATTAGIQVFGTGGDHLGTIPVPRPPQNIAFAGADKKTLYIVGRGAAYKVQLITPGFVGRAK